MSGAIAQDLDERTPLCKGPTCPAPVWGGDPDIPDKCRYASGFFIVNNGIKSVCVAPHTIIKWNGTDFELGRQPKGLP